jgi:acyl-CoA reductase-like NAD-dependent aldehyde dehydrogenase
MKPIQLISPVDGSVYAERMPLSPEAAKAAVARARAAQGPWAARPLAERIALVKAGVARLTAMKETVALELSHQMGRPIRYGQGEMGGVNARTDYMSDIAAETLAHHMIEDSDKFRRYLARDPLGVVFIIAPWNYPYLTTINTLAPALIAGNTVVLKHASQTLLVGERLAQAFHEAGVPADVFQNVVLDHATTESLIAGRAFNFVNFTGSVAGGQAIERAAAGTFTPLGLELGGKDPGYVRADANLDAAVDTLMAGVLTSRLRALGTAAAVALLLARIPSHKVQAQALGNVFNPMTGDAMPVREARALIQALLRGHA